MAATRFSHSATRNSDLTKSRPKYTTTSGLTTTTFLTHFSDKNKFHGISDHFQYLWKYFRFLHCTSGPRLRFCAPGVLIENISSRTWAIRRQCRPEIRQKKSIQGALEAKPEVEIWRRPVFLTQRTRLSICPKVGQSTQLLAVLQIHFRLNHNDFLHAFFELCSI